MAGSISNLMRKLWRKIDERKTVQLSPDELDLLVMSGAMDAICNAALEAQKAQSAARLASTTLPISCASGLSRTKETSEKAAEALEQVQTLLGKKL